MSAKARRRITDWHEWGCNEEVAVPDVKLIDCKDRLLWTSGSCIRVSVCHHIPEDAREAPFAALLSIKGWDKLSDRIHL